MEDQLFMKRAIELAKNGWGRTNPNPLVGAVIVKDGKIIGEGWHDKIGGPHAEINAINNYIEDMAGATIYVSLEPCSHYGRTPPCAVELIKRKFSRVVVAIEDPNPKVAGNGIRMLRDNGIQVDVGCLSEEAFRLNDIFIKYISAKTPFVLLKSAMTLDGKTATHTGDSKWISGDSSRQYVHELRSRYSSILVGVNTVIKDDPELTARLEGKEGVNPLRIILDSEGRISGNSKILDISKDKRTLIATTSRVNKEKVKFWESKGIDVVIAESQEDGRIDLQQLMAELYKKEIDSVLVEGGGTVSASFIEKGLVDKVAIFIAPVIVGGRDAPTPVMGHGVNSINKGFRLKHQRIQTFGNDVLIEGYIKVPWREEE